MQVTGPAKLARDPDFRDRALIAALREAGGVLREDPATPNHTFRKSYAQSILRSPLQYADTVTWVLAAAPALADVGDTSPAVPDDLITATLHEMWDALSQP